MIRMAAPYGVEVRGDAEGADARFREQIGGPDENTVNYTRIYTRFMRRIASIET